MARCKKGRVKSGPRKGQCRKVRRRSASASSCPYGKVKSGPRKGRCRKRPVRRRR